MTPVEFRDATPYEPPGHHGVVNRLLVGRETGVEDVSVWHGTLAPGGGSDVHVHQDSVQIYVGLAGGATVTVADVEHRLESLTTITIPAATPHSIRNEEDREAALLVISVPALR